MNKPHIKLGMKRHVKLYVKLLSNCHVNYEAQGSTLEDSTVPRNGILELCLNENLHCATRLSVTFRLRTWTIIETKDLGVAALNISFFGRTITMHTLKSWQFTSIFKCYR